MKTKYRNNYNPVRFFKKIKQINNLIIWQDESVTMTEFKVATIDKIILEEFCCLKDAEEFCTRTHDFITRNQKHIK